MRSIVAAMSLFLGASAASAQLPPITPLAAPIDRAAIPLGTGGVPDGAAAEAWFALGGQSTVRNVTQATLTPVLPKPGRGTGAAVIIAPGGGFLMLSMQNEGWPVARWFADHGIAAFVLKYRLKPTPVDPVAFGQKLGRVFSGAEGKAGLAVPSFAVEDGFAALRLVRQRAGQWGVDPARVGFVGFSAGAETALAVVETASVADMPAFVAPIYGPMTAIDVPATAPPLFAALASDDPLFGRDGYGLTSAWLAKGKTAEMHVFAAGGHGFGLGRPGTTSVGWIETFYRWLDAGGFLKKTS